MVNAMENAEEVMQILERFTRLKQKEIPKELDEYLQYVAKTGDTVFKWPSLKYLFREKLLNVIKNFHDSTPLVDEIPQYPNVDPFNYESMKSSLLERLEHFNAAPFTVQRLCELLIDPRKQYSRIDKFMRALEKNILVSTIEPGRKRTESENGDSLDSSVVNGDLSLDVNVDIDMDGETGAVFNAEIQNGNGKAAPAEVAATEADAAIAEDAAAAAAVVDSTSSKAMEEDDVSSKPDSVVEKPAGSEKHVATDNDILPNPKKAKLDLADEEAEKPTENPKEKEPKSTENKAEEAEKQKEQKIQSDTVEIATIVAVADAKEQNGKKDETDMSQQDAQTTSAQDGKLASETDPTEVKIVAKDEDKPKEKSDEPEKEGAAADAISKPEDGNKLENEEKPASPVSSDNVDGAVGANVDENKTTDEEETVIEKQDNEQGEKEQKLSKEAAVKAEAEVKDVAETAAENDVAEAKVTEDIVETAAVAVESQEKIEQESPEKTEDLDIEAATEAKEDIATKSDTDADKQELKGESKDDASESTEQPAEPAAVAEEAKEEKHAEVEQSKAQEKLAEVKVCEDEKTAEEQPEKAASHPVVATEIAEVSAKGSEAAVETAEMIAEAATTTATPTDTAAAAVAVTLPTPSLALNDQPMDEESLTGVDEVVMAESAANDMATEPAKEEATGMEVDDTSQEAMDH